MSGETPTFGAMFPLTFLAVSPVTANIAASFGHVLPFLLLLLLLLLLPRLLLARLLRRRQARANQQAIEAAAKKAVEEALAARDVDKGKD